MDTNTGAAPGAGGLSQAQESKLRSLGLTSDIIDDIRKANIPAQVLDKLDTISSPQQFATDIGDAMAAHRSNRADTQPGYGWNANDADDLSTGNTTARLCHTRCNHTDQRTIAPSHPRRTSNLRSHMPRCLHRGGIHNRAAMLRHRRAIRNSNNIRSNSRAILRSKAILSSRGTRRSTSRAIQLRHL